MTKFEVDIWFDQKPKKLHLGSVTVEADTEEQAHKIAWQNTEHWMTGKATEN